MASFEELLMQTMPLVAAYIVYTEGGADFPSLFGGEPIAREDEVKVIDLGIDENYEAEKPEIVEADYNTPHDVNIWRWSHAASKPWLVSDVYCRVRSAKYRSHKVLDSIEWGFEASEARGVFKNCVRITNLAGKRVELPLTKEFVAYKAAIIGGRIVDGQTDLWKLASKHDESLIVALLYSLEPGQPPRAMTAAEANDLGNDFMPSGGAAAPTNADVHGDTSADVAHARVLVVLSLTTCKQSEDFAPGGAVGMGRIYPHIMIMSSMALNRIEATVRLNRPEATIMEQDGIEPPQGIGEKLVDILSGPKGCCAIYDHDPSAPAAKINSVLFTDANDFEISPLNPPPPFWGNLFSYYLLDAYQTVGDLSLVAVTRDSIYRNTRDLTGFVVRQPVMGPPDYPLLRKMPFQGHFDNVHMAPKMRLYNAKKAVHVENAMTSPTPFEIPIESLHVDDISMAPFCAHDCFHTHWRWGTGATDKAQWGFDGMVPYAKPGRVSVPHNQSVDVWLRAPNLLTYTATVWPLGGNPISANQWQVIMHHGSGYALDITGYVITYLAKIAIDSPLGGQPLFYAADNTLITSTMSFSVMYWKLRWQTVLVDGKPQLRERIVHKDFDGARKG